MNTDKTSLVPACGIDTPILEFREIDSFYGSVQVHFGLNISVLPGTIVCLLGAKESGKSSALKVALGVLRPQRGMVLWQGNDISTCSPSQRMQAGIAGVPAMQRVFPHITVLENILVQGYGEIDQKVLNQKIEATWQRFPKLAAQRGHMAGALSAARQQELAIARALMSAPRLLCVDEPTKGLLPREADEVLLHLKNLSETAGIAILLTEKNAMRALQISDYAYVLQNGMVVLEGRSEILLDSPATREALGGTAGSPGGHDVDARKPAVGALSEHCGTS